MIPLEIISLDGTKRRIDMERLTRVAKGVSQIHPGWRSTLTFSDELGAFVELSAAEPDVRGNGEGAAAEVDDAYAKRVYGKSRRDIGQ